MIVLLEGLPLRRGYSWSCCMSLGSSSGYLILWFPPVDPSLPYVSLWNSLASGRTVLVLPPVYVQGRRETEKRRTKKGVRKPARALGRKQALDILPSARAEKNG